MSRILLCLCAAFVTACGPTLRIAPIEAWSDELDAEQAELAPSTYAHGGWFLVTEGKRSSVMFCLVEPELQCWTEAPRGGSAAPAAGGARPVLNGGGISY